MHRSKASGKTHIKKNYEIEWRMNWNEPPFSD